MESHEEEARRCPKCKMPGENVSTQPIPEKPGDKVLIMQCANDRCVWFGSGGWVIQIKRDGSIPVRPTKGPKQFEPMRGWHETAARDEIEDLHRRGLDK